VHDGGASTRSGSFTGLPSFETAEAEDRGELAIGGCLWSEESPDRRCKAFGWELNVLTENVT